MAGDWVTEEKPREPSAATRRLPRYDFEMYGDDPQFPEEPDGQWVKYEDATSPAGLHVLLDLMVAQFIVSQPSGAGLPSRTTLLDFMRWSFKRSGGETPDAAR
mgnify:CR=1 FL=1